MVHNNPLWKRPPLNCIYICKHKTNTEQTKPLGIDVESHQWNQARAGLTDLRRRGLHKELCRELKKALQQLFTSLRTWHHDGHHDGHHPLDVDVIVP